MVAALGAVLLLASLFLDWFDVLSAWTAFELLDLLIAAVALGALAALANRFGVDTPVREALVPLFGAVAMVIVVSQLINRPPAGNELPLREGAWLALGGAALLLAGGVLSVAGISLSIQIAPRAGLRGGSRAAATGAGGRSPSPPPAEPSPSAEARAAEPEVQGELYPESERSGPIGANDPTLRDLEPPDERTPRGREPAEGGVPRDPGPREERPGNPGGRPGPGPRGNRSIRPGASTRKGGRSPLPPPGSRARASASSGDDAALETEGERPD